MQPHGVQVCDCRVRKHVAFSERCSAVSHAVPGAVGPAPSPRAWCQPCKQTCSHPGGHVSSPGAPGWPVELGCSCSGLGAVPRLPEPWSPEAARERGTAAAPPARWGRALPGGPQAPGVCQLPAATHVTPGRTISSSCWRAGPGAKTVVLSHSI